VGWQLLYPLGLGRTPAPEPASQYGYFFDIKILERQTKK